MIVRGKRPWWKFVVSPAAVFLAPGVLLYTLFFVYPALSAFHVSLHEWTGFSPEKTLVGFSNFKELLYDGKFRGAIANNFIFMFGGGLATFACALLFAAALSNRKFPGRRFFKTVLFAPYVVSVVGLAILWKFIYDSKWGLLNGMLNGFVGVANGLLALCERVLNWMLNGLVDVASRVCEVCGIETRLPEVTTAWLGEATTAIPALVVVMVWGGIGFYMVLLMAGIDRIPDDLYEAARIDGASETQNFFHITLPLLRDVLVVAISIYIIGSLKTFGLIWAMTKGINSTHVMGTYMYEVAFDPATMTWRMGYGTAMTVVLFFLVILITFTFNKIMRRREIEY